MPGTPLAPVIEEHLDKGPVKIWVRGNMMGPLLGDLSRKCEGVLILQMPPDAQLGGQKHPPLFILESDVWAISKAHGREITALNGGRPPLSAI